MRSTLASTLPTSLRSQAGLAQSGKAHYVVSGEVDIEEEASIGPGVLLRANPGCRIHIGRGVCIGAGSILHACGGSLVVEAGATLGRGVLVIGQGTISENACIGSEATLLNCSILPQAVIPPGSLLGDPTWGSEQETAGVTQTEPEETERVQELPSAPVQGVSEAPPPSSEAEVTPQEQAAAEPAQEQRGAGRLNGIPGRAELERLLGKIYPHRQVLSSRDGRF
jgi:carbon dioxide concentrating mechanism protein CcmN